MTCVKISINDLNEIISFHISGKIEREHPATDFISLTQQKKISDIVHIDLDFDVDIHLSVDNLMMVYIQNAVDSVWYLNRYLDVADAGVDPRQHFADFGRAENRYPNRIAENAAIVSDFVDAAWYIERYPDVAAAEMDAVLHYNTHGRDEGRFANNLSEIRGKLVEYVDVKWYQTRYDDLVEHSINPLLHYISYGHGEHRFPSQAAETNSSFPSAFLAKHLSRIYIETLHRNIEYFEFKRWEKFWRLGVSLAEIECIVSYGGGL